MIYAALIRDDISSECIRGKLYIEDQIFHTLERPWLHNTRNKSCIPALTYEAHYMAKSGSGKYKKVYWLQDVPGRSGVLIHNGNVVDHSRGCILLGMHRGMLGEKRAVLASRIAMRKFNEITNKQPMKLAIIGGQSI